MNWAGYNIRYATKYSPEHPDILVIEIVRKSIEKRK